MSVYKLFLPILLFVTGTVFFLGSGSTPSLAAQARAPAPAQPQVKWVWRNQLGVVDYVKASEIPREAAIRYLNTVVENHVDAEFYKEHCELNNDGITLYSNSPSLGRITVPYDDPGIKYIIKTSTLDETLLLISKKPRTCYMIVTREKYTRLRSVLNNAVTALYSLGIEK